MLEVGRNADSQLTFHLTAGIAEQSIGAGQSVETVFTGPIVALAEFGGAHSTGGSHQELHANRFFQLGDFPANRRDRDVQMSGSRRKSSLFHHRGERSHSVEIGFHPPDTILADLGSNRLIDRLAVDCLAAAFRYSPCGPWLRFV